MLLSLIPKRLSFLDKERTALYTDYLIFNQGLETATSRSAMLDGEVKHDQLTRHLSARLFTTEDLWVDVKPTVRQIERDDGCLIFDDTVQEKAFTDENEMMCWHYDHCKGRSVKGINLLNALYHNGDVTIPVAFEVVKKPHPFCDIKTRKVKRAAKFTKNELTRPMVATCVANAIKSRRVLTDAGLRRKRTSSSSSRKANTSPAP